MYRWLLCFRYLRTRYIALASIISVTLGVATLIVVNSVMAGFSAEMHDRLHGLASDLLIECHATGGMPDPDAHLAEIRRVLGDQIDGASVSVHVPGMLGIDFNGQLITRHVNLVGVDAETYDTVSHFGRYLLHPENRQHVDFELRDSGYAPDREFFPASGWEYRRARVAYERALQAERDRIEALSKPAEPVAAEDPAVEAASQGPSFGPALPPTVPQELLADSEGGGAVEFDPATEQFPGIILGIATCSTKHRDAQNNVRDHYYCRPGDDVRMMFPNASEKKPEVVNQKFTVVDMYESGMSEYDSTFAFVRLDRTARNAWHDRSAKPESEASRRYNSN